MKSSDIPDRVHFVGIGGVGQSALAQHLLQSGHIVSGSDRIDSEMLTTLRRAGATVYVGHDASNIRDVQLVVRTSAVPLCNDEVVEAKKRGIPVVLREELLGAIVNDFLIRVCISGTHGKTTTTAMVSHLLRRAGVSHAAFIGGNFHGSNYLYGENIAVCEACEYNRSFLQLHPNVAVCLNAEFDHPDCYADQSATEQAFGQFVSSVGDGIAVLPVELSCLSTSKTLLCGNGGDVYADNVVLSRGIPNFDLIVDGSFVARCKLRVGGLHNMQNALFAVAVCKCLDVPLIQVAQSLCSFDGVDRRWSEHPCKRCRVITDYAHHPTEINASLFTAKSMCKNTVCVFQPHTFSRTKAFMRQFADCFADTKVIFLPIYAAREQPIDGVNSKQLYVLAEKSGADAYYADNFAQASEIADKLISDKTDILLVLGAGDVADFAEYFIAKTNISN